MQVSFSFFIVNNQAIKINVKKHIYLVLNKPKGYLSATKDLKDKTVIKINVDDYKNDVSLTGEFIRTTLNSEETKEIQGEIITLGLRALRGEDLE